MRRLLLLTLAGAALLLAGCYGTTEPATHLRPNAAWLEARGTANNGPASSYFEYWPTADPSSQSNPGQRSWPAGASAPFHEEVFGLRRATAYSFHVCGGDSGQLAQCAQTRTFTTPDGDAVDAQSRDQYFKDLLAVHASSGAHGESPQGTYSASELYDTFDGHVTCLAVSAGRAAVGAVGTFTPTGSRGSPRPQSRLLTVEARGGLTKDTFDQVVAEGGTPPACAHASYAHQYVPYAGTAVVQDAP